MTAGTAAPRRGRRDGLFKRLGLAEAVQAKAILVAERLLTGDADLPIHQVSEILPVAGVTLVGTLPAAVQNYTTYGVGLAASAAGSAAARTFLQDLAGSPGASAIQAKGMLPP